MWCRQGQPGWENSSSGSVDAAAASGLLFQLAGRPRVCPAVNSHPRGAGVGIGLRLKRA